MLQRGAGRQSDSAALDQRRRCLSGFVIGQKTADLVLRVRPRLTFAASFDPLSARC
jgi:hypothetical protein